MQNHGKGSYQLVWVGANNIVPWNDGLYMILIPAEHLASISVLNCLLLRIMPPEEVTGFCSEHKILCCESIFMLILTFAGFVFLTTMADVRTRAKQTQPSISRGDKAV